MAPVQKRHFSYTGFFESSDVVHPRQRGSPTSDIRAIAYFVHPTPFALTLRTTRVDIRFTASAGRR